MATTHRDPSIAVEWSANAGPKTSFANIHMFSKRQKLCYRYAGFIGIWKTVTYMQRRSLGGMGVSQPLTLKFCHFAGQKRHFSVLLQGNLLDLGPLVNYCNKKNVTDKSYVPAYMK